MKPITLEGSLLNIAIDAPHHSGLGATLSYSSERSLTPGSLVRVPLGKREVTGVVWSDETLARETSSSYELRAIVEALDAVQPLPSVWMRLVEFAANYYQRSLGEMALSALPQELRRVSNMQLARRVKRLQKKVAANPNSRDGAQDAQPPLSPLTHEQEQALQAMARLPAGGTALLHGATGSGKTEVYLHEIQRVLRAGGQALVLVPEINLTPQLLRHFEQRLHGQRIVTLHSGLTPAARLQHWLLAHMGQADVVLGTRLAVFTPLPRLQLVVVDEEHEASYKQQEGARYSARDLAVVYARLSGAKAVLGSATPSLETWFNAQVREGGGTRYHYIAMPTRVGAGAMPRVRLIDMQQERRARSAPAGDAPLSLALRDALQTRLQRGEQSLILLNRRGYAPVLQCMDCGWHSQCPHCTAWRVYHKQDRSLRCHHCGWTERVPRACPDCGNLDIRAVGQGTERLEEQLGAALPQARVARIDGDVTRHQGALEELLGRVHRGDVDILVGTQMVAKGHDFRNVTLVAAVNPDSALYSHDFRAPERLFALLMQAAGRAGRDAKQAAHSEMLIQTWSPRHPLYAAVQADDFQRFAQSQLDERRSAGLPPWTHLALLRAQARTQQAALDFLSAAAAAARELPQAQHLTLYPPVPAAMPRVANVERVQMLVESDKRSVLQQFLKAWQPGLHALAQQKSRPEARVLRWALDVDPLDI